MACFLVNTSGLSGRTYDAQDHKFGWSKLLAATWTDIVKRQLLALLSPSGILSRPFIKFGLVPMKLCHSVP